MKGVFRGAVLAASVFSSSIQAQVAPAAASLGETTLTGALTEASIPVAFRSAPPTDTYAGLTADLHRRTTLRLQNAVLRLDSGTHHVITAETLRLVSSRVVTNGADLDIYVGTLVTDDASSIESFERDDPAPSPNSSGPNGAKGHPGRPGGKIRIFVAQRVDGLPNIHLDGSIGGHGEAGRPGATGA